jgi:aspartate carbamoyltransferase catalytic subunit
LREKGRIDGLKWLAVGDMRMRTMHSLGYALSQFDCPITFVSPPEMGLTDEFRQELKQYSVDFKEVDHVEMAIADADVILVEPVVQPDYSKSRDERSGDLNLTPANYRITRELLETKAKSDAILLHSLPRMDEIPLDVDITRWSRYWQEAANGVVMRMALLALVLGAME